jgi:DNA polymerase-3 subunit epsilon
MAEALLAGAPDVSRDHSGRWSLVREQPVARTSEAVSRSLGALCFAVVDVETTGSSPVTGDRMTEFCAVSVDCGRITGVFETLLNPERPIPAAVTRLTKISWEMVRTAPTVREAAPRIAEVLDGRLFVAHNAAFDWRFVSTELAELGGRTVRGQRLCTVKLARAVLPQLRRRSLDALSWYYGIENHARHRAGGDAVATAKVLLRLLDAARDRGCDTLEDLTALTRRVPARRRRRRRGLPGFADGEMTA